MTEYSTAHAVREIAEELIPAHHSHLIEFGARIEYVWRDEAAKSKGKIVLGKARRISGLNAFLAREDRSVEGEGVQDFFVVEIAEDTWADLTPAQRRALVDHELSHCGVDWGEAGDLETRLVLRAHDCEEFCSVVRRHGLWKPDLAALVRFGAEAEQLELLPKVQASTEVQAMGLLDVLRRVGASADDAVAMSLLDRRLAAVSAGLDDDITDATWLTVVQALRAEAEAGVDAP